MKPHRNFANAPVNFNHSSVHVPTNVYDKGMHLKVIIVNLRATAIKLTTFIFKTLINLELSNF